MPSLTPNNTPQQRGQGTKGPGWGGRSKALAFWIFVILVPIAFLKLSRGSAEATPTISYTEYQNQRDAGHIKKVTIQGGQKVTGEFNTPRKVDPNNPQKSVSRFTVLWPVADSETEVTALTAKGVEIESKEQNISLGTFL